MISALGPIIAAVITGVLGLYAGALKGAPGVPSPTPSVSVSTTTVTVPATATPSESGSGGGARALYHEGRLQLAFATCVDLDAPTGDPQWGESSSTSGGVDFCSESPGFAGVNGATIVTVDSGTDTTCQTRRDGSERTPTRTSISVLAVSYAFTPTKVASHCFALTRLTPLLSQLPSPQRPSRSPAIRGTLTTARPRSLAHRVDISIEVHE